MNRVRFFGIAVFPFLILVAVVTGLFWKSILRGQVPMPANYMLSWYEPWKSETTVNGVPTLVHKPVVDDSFRHLYPLRVIASDQMLGGLFPLWNPYAAAGTPLLAITHPGYLTPFGVWFLFLSPPVAWTLYILFQPVVLGAAMYWYGKKLGMSRVGAVFATIVLLLSGFSVVRLEYGEFLYVLAGLPVLLGIIEEMRLRKQSGVAVWIAPVVCMMIFSGQPHMVVYALTVFAAYALYRLPFFRAVIAGIWSVLGVGAAAIQLAPGLELYSRSTINHQTSGFIFDRFLLPVSHLLTVAVPNYFGNQATYNYFGPHDYVETIAYTGSIAVLFALFATWRKRNDSIVRFFVMLGVLSVVLTIDWPGARWFYSLPIPVLSSDVPSRIFVLLAFAVSVLAGFGISLWSAADHGEKRRWIVGTVCAAGGVIAAALYAYLRHMPCPPTIPQCRMVSLRTAGIEFAGLGIVLGASFVGASRLRKKTGGYTVWGVICVVLVLGLYNAGKFLPFAPKDRVFPPVPVFTELQKTPDYGRYAGIGGADFRTNLTAYYHLYSLNYFDPLHLRRYAELVSFANTGSRVKDIKRSDVQVVSDSDVGPDTAVRRERLWDMTGVSRIVAPEGELTSRGAQPVWEDAHWQVFPRETALPRAYLVSHVVTEPDSDRLLAQMFAPDTDLATTAFVEVPIEGIQASENMHSGTVSIREYSPQRIILDVDVRTSTALAVLSDVWYPGWIATVDGTRRTMYRTNYAFRSVVVPKGKHTVTYVYSPDSLRTGILISGLSVLGWAVAAVVVMRKKT